MTDPVPTSVPSTGQPPAPGAHPAPAGYAAPSPDPGYTLGIVALVCAFAMPIAGVVLGFLAMQQSRRAGFQNVPALAGLIISAVSVVLMAVFFVVWLLLVVLIMLIPLFTYQFGM